MMFEATPFVYLVQGACPWCNWTCLHEIYLRFLLAFTESSGRLFVQSKLPCWFWRQNLAPPSNSALKIDMRLKFHATF